MIEEKKFDYNSLIGFVLIALILIWMLYQNAPTEEELIERAKTEQVEKAADTTTTPAETPATPVVTETTTQEPASDSLRMEALKNQLGSFAYAATLPSATEEVTTLENDILELKISNKGGYIVEATLKKHKTFDSIPVYLIKDGNADFNLQFQADNRLLNTRDLFFEPSLTQSGENTILSMKLKASENQYLEYRYELKPGEYMLDFAIQTQGLNNIINTSNPAEALWQLKAHRKAKSISYENRYTEMLWEYEDGKDDYLGQGSLTEDDARDVTWIAYKQHFFTSVLLTDTPFKTAHFTSENLVEDEEIDSLYTKNFVSKFPLEFKAGELSYTMNWYYGPSDFKILDGYERNLDEIIPLGWGIFGWINKFLFMPLFTWLATWITSYGIIIIVMTILIKIALSPVQYKQYLSQAKMKILRPEIEEITKKYKDNAMKKQQETMKLYSKAGASPMAGCIPALMQLPVFYALFMFFPSAFDLRQKGFLWADDLSSYDSIAELPFYIPFYGDHVSLFPILASIAIFIYMMMTTGQTMQMQQQPGMPNMKFIMYLSPLIMLVFFNNFASGLSLYYFISNVITIGIMLVIKYFVLDEQKILAKIEEKKKQPKKQNRFQRKMSEIMEQAEKQKQIQEQKKKK
ncbi:membrane protein insertase YidC [Planktosalinus lacus]|uniref:Membrane protein insertase YidC n=1 Tax=Planktosalinus lacus TaxID=1526573 RepID=A0A8J2Y717_9FLAO|nr:membrane protein insertase YidC [Planktosalinus lacus]